GKSKTLAFNALGQPLETEDENGRIGGGPGGGAFTDSPPPQPASGAQAPNLQFNGLFAKTSLLSAQWSGTGLLNGATVPAAQLYYRLTLDAGTGAQQQLMSWTPGALNYRSESISAGGHTLTVEATYAD